MTICYEQSATMTCVQLIKVTKTALSDSQKHLEESSNFK